MHQVYVCEYILCITTYQLSVATAMVQYPADKTSISTVTLRYIDESFTTLIYFQMRCSMTVSSQANNAPELVQYRCKLRDAEQDKTL